MDDLYQTVFQVYAQEVQETVEDEDTTKSMRTFLEEGFKSIIEKIKDSTETVQF